jgi:undecaprenyl-diphosphatase
MNGKVAALSSRLLAAEVDLCRLATRAQAQRFVRSFFRTVSRLGDGPLWFALALALPLLAGADALSTVARMAVVGVLAALVSKGLKITTRRARPFLAHAGIPLGAQPLDAGSFPSGHTLHAVAFTLVVCADLPGFALALVPFACAVGASRVVLGLHYPSDVAAGAAVGALLGWFVLAFA